MKYLCSLFLFCAFSCVDSKVREMEMFIKEWKGKEISFPEGLVTINRDSTSLNEVLNADYKIVTYIDSTGCVSCKLNLYMWNLFKKDVQTLAHKDVSLLFYFCPKDIEELRFLMKRKGVDSLESLRAQALEQGVEFIACQMSMDMMGISREELLDEVTIGGVATYMERADKANVNLFI